MDDRGKCIYIQFYFYFIMKLPMHFDRQMKNTCERFYIEVNIASDYNPTVAPLIGSYTTAQSRTGRCQSAMEWPRTVQPRTNQLIIQVLKVIWWLMADIGETERW